MADGDRTANTMANKKGQKDKQWWTKHYTETKDPATRTLLKKHYTETKDPATRTLLKKHYTETKDPATRTLLKHITQKQRIQ